ncbi:hypothetical protein [Piscinibacterium candidicorallinum]|uniref:Uncharacterized protein n=1 Tax=Piscinibacterium candidicorallinum TaxID=1793872 RepID=A0ABV7HAE5_9BURK
MSIAGHRLKVVLAVALLIVMVAFWWARNRTEPTDPAREARIPSAGFADHPVAAAQAPALASVVRSDIAESPLLGELYASANLAQFFEHALRRPEEGGVYFAIKSLQLCLFPFEDSAETQAPSAAQLRARALMQARCSALNQGVRTDSSEDHALKRIQDLERGDLAKRDPLIQARERLYALAAEHADASRRTEALNALMQAGGAGVLYGELQQIDLHQRIFFQGKPFGGVDRLAFQRALIVYRMERSLAAGGSDGGNLALTFCASTGRCDGDAFARVLGSVQDSDTDAVRHVYPALRDALNKADVSAFAVPNQADPQ